MSDRRFVRWVCTVSAALVLAGSGGGLSSAAETPVSSFIADVGIDQNLNAQAPLELAFRDETGKAVKLGDYFGRRPVILSLAYFRCPMLCTQVLNSVLRTSQGMELRMGADYDVVTVSFDPSDTPEMAAEKKSAYVRSYRREGAAEGWHFLTGKPAAIEQLTRTVGYRYHYDRKSDQYAHASGVIVLTPEGKISHYFYGLDYSPKDLRLALVQSSAGKIGSPAEKLLLLCYEYDPTTGKYGIVISRVIRLAGMLTVTVLGGFLLVMFRQERRRTQEAALAEARSSPTGAAQAGPPDPDTH